MACVALARPRTFKAGGAATSGVGGVKKESFTARKRKGGWEGGRVESKTNQTTGQYFGDRTAGGQENDFQAEKTSGRRYKVGRNNEAPAPLAASGKVLAAAGGKPPPQGPLVGAY